MFCGKCGKKVNDDMLFCPFCGNAIVVPDQDEETEEANAVVQNEKDPKRVEIKSRKPISLFADESFLNEESEEFIPLSEERYDESEDISEPEEEPIDIPEDELAFEDEVEEFGKEEENIEEESEAMPASHAVPRMSRPAVTPMNSRRGAYIPVRDTKSEDMFLGTDRDEYDDDDYDDDDYDDFSDEYDFDDVPKESFFKRHMIALIAFGAIVIMLIAGAAFTISSPGQEMLARINLAWNADAYAKVGFKEHSEGNYAQSASYYVRAHEKDPTNYEYAHSAMVAYYNANDIDNAAQMAIKCITLKPNEAEPYRELLTIYGVGEIPAIARDYIQQGYQKTGDEYLNPANWANR